MSRAPSAPSTVPTHRIRQALPLGARRWIRARIDMYGELTSGWRLMPSYLIIGAQKGGTSALYEYLVRHPLVGRSMVEEIHYFTYNYAKGVRWYRGHFPTSLQAALVRARHGRPMITGESTPYYLFHPLAPARIWELLPHANLIVMLRNPVDRAYSHYNHARQMGVEPIGTFEEALAAEPERLAGEEERMLADPTYNSDVHWHFAYLNRGMYADQLERLYSLFPTKQVFVGRAETLNSDPASMYSDVLRFLGLPPYELPTFPRYNSRRYPPMAGETRRRLTEHFREPNQRLYDLLGADMEWDTA